MMTVHGRTNGFRTNNKESLALALLFVAGALLAACSGGAASGTDTGAPTPGSDSGADTTAPTVTITSPTSGSAYSSASTTVTLAGNASDDVGVTQVTWSNSAGGSGSAAVSGSDTYRTWSADVALQPGTNAVTVTAKDAANHAGTDSITVTYAPPAGTYALTVSVTGPGTVSSDPAGVSNCSGSCGHAYSSGTAVTLTARAGSGASFSAWGGACSGTAPTSACHVTMDAAKAVSATFAGSTGSGLCSGAGVGGITPVNYSALAKPGKGQAVTDPDFGTTIRRITDAKGDWNDSVAVPAYPTVQAWNADESLLILYTTGGSHPGWALLDGKTYAFKQWLDINPADVEQFYWSTTNPALLYYVDNHQSGTTNYDALTQLNVLTGVKTVLHDFAPDMLAGGKLSGICPYSGMKVSGGEDPFYMSYDNDLIGLGCYLNRDGPGGASAFAAFSYRISTNTIGTPFTVEADVPQALPSGHGTYFYSSETSVRVLDAATNAVQRTIAYDGTQHSDMLLGAGGDDLVAGPQFDGPSGSGTLMVANLTRGGVTTIISDYPPSGTLISGKSWQNPGWVAMAMTGCPSGSNGNCNGYTPVAAADPQTYLDQEVLLADVDGGTVCRLAHHRTTGNYSNARNSNYWAQPNIVISPSGTRILFASDWGAADPKHVTVDGSAVVDTYVIELPGYRGG
jgi:Divergent InlB B-repeat domain/Bacterial Ig domain